MTSTDDSPSPRPHGRLVEVETLAQLDALLASGARSMSGWRLQGLDLVGHGAALRDLDAAGAVLLGCRLEREDEESLRARQALVFPGVPGVPFDPYRSELYTPEELYAGLEEGYPATLDARVYAWSRQRSATEDVAQTLAQALHDHAVDDALREYVAGRRLVGVMGGHALGRDTAEYAGAARLGRDLAQQGYLVATGGGPGAMEAANLGARLHRLDVDAFRASLEHVTRAPHFRPSVEEWAQAAFDVLAAVPDPAPTLGIPTWFYGHEPPNPFAAQIAKYFRNALREDTLLNVCSGGIVFLPGSAGTVQEIFQDACENYYGAPETVTPMVLVGQEHWQRRFPAWPLLQSLAAGRQMEDRIFLVDTVQDALAVLDTRG